MITIEDIVYARIAAPDLDVMERFLLDFGMRPTQRTDRALYLHGYGTDPVCHVVERGDAKHIGFALRAGSHEDLERLAAEVGRKVERRSEPGDGFVVRLEDPNGNQLEVVHGVSVRAAEPLRAPLRNNPIINRSRFNEAVRLESSAAHVMRLGHVALHALDFHAMHDFYRNLFGLKLSDSYYMEKPDKMMGAFLHCGLGDRYTDHHTVAVVGTGRSGFDHLGFEVLDFDDLMLGNRHLKSGNGWEHSWGVGRHVEGSQIFDYWRDPTGLKVEHWTDGDLVNDAYRGHHVEFSVQKAEHILAQWAPPFSPDFVR